MKLMVVTLFAILFAVVSAENECFEHRTKHKWSVGESYNPIGECITYKCLPGGAMEGKTCPDEMAIGCDYISEDLSKPYPECCPKWKCNLYEAL